MNSFGHSSHDGRRLQGHLFRLTCHTAVGNPPALPIAQIRAILPAGGNLRFLDVPLVAVAEPGDCAFAEFKVSSVLVGNRPGKKLGVHGHGA